MQKKFEINRTKIKGGCQSGRKVVTHDSKSDLPLEWIELPMLQCSCDFEVNQTKIKSGCQSGRIIVPITWKN